jgi:hypothetical protein
LVSVKVEVSVGEKVFVLEGVGVEVNVDVLVLV